LKPNKKWKRNEKLSKAKKLFKFAMVRSEKSEAKGRDKQLIFSRESAKRMQNRSRFAFKQKNICCKTGAPYSNNISSVQQSFGVGFRETAGFLAYSRQ
jgi:hypothetical protein